MRSIKSQQNELTLLSIAPGLTHGARVQYSDSGDILRLTPTFKTPGHIPLPRLRNVHPLVVSLHPSFCHVEEISFHITELGQRSEEQEINRLIEDLLYKKRSKAGEQLGVSEMDAILVDAHIDELERHTEGVKGVLCGIFIGREIFESIQPRLRMAPRFFFTHPLKSALALLRKNQSEKKFYIVSLEEQQGLFYGREQRKGPIFKKGTISWTPQAIVNRIASDWHISSALAKEMYRAALQGHCSSHVKKYIETIVEEESRRFFKEITQESINGSIYIDSLFPLPFALPRTYRWKNIQPLPDKLSNRHFLANSSLAPVHEFLEMSDRADIHRAIQRKIHWIAMPEK